ncbi:formate dehydrogenase accessory sulfurtransferase FdhD [Roseibacterium sp. SDUM158016]|uniref:formate dehydrogenase accessory sulfurtransferase FdhD n=1 Tax=Roseicyclus sediminis TaxID=2980997 RepID=UPI0021D2939D|nr:formate dehydrogenase accessory sulfurtransferase FdhD [Roseibacterium sp. SDUM158016]MCU4651717.1 formate dehydrogenase accessory sulfurtransferase FdhD [Roseibacterium sp. SDUM158016]
MKMAGALKGSVTGIRGLALAGAERRDIARALPEETPVAITVNGSTQAVMMASPADIEDFAVGFALSEGIVGRLDEIEAVEALELPGGIEARLWIAPEKAEALGARRRAMLGPVGCGLCGIDSLEEAIRPLPKVTDATRFAFAEIAAAAEALRAHQPLHDLTRAVHAAGFLVPGRGIVAAREDVGRHNALDKLIGALARAGVDVSGGAFVLTSRVSVDMVQKAAIAGAGTIVAVSAPTAHALRLAEAAGMTLAAFARAGAVEIYSHAQRITEDTSDVA